MSSTSRAWTVEAMKDQGICRWGNALGSLQQHAKNSVGSYSQTKKLSTPSSSAISKKYKCDNTKESEESLRKVMYLSCWGPNWGAPNIVCKYTAIFFLFKYTAYDIYLLLYDGNMYEIPKSVSCKNIEKENHMQDNTYVVRQFSYIHGVITISLKKP